MTTLTQDDTDHLIRMEKLVETPKSVALAVQRKVAILLGRGHSKWST